jgi:prepilin-type N-terminal cleavage/methylation domain-containing protein
MNMTKGVRSGRATRRAFTILEMIAVVAVVAITSVIVGQTMTQVRENVRDNSAEQSLNIFARTAQGNYALLSSSPSRWQTAVEQAGADVVAADENGGAPTPFTLKRYTIATASTTYAELAGRDISYFYQVVDGVDTLGLAMVSAANNCIYLSVTLSSVLKSWSAGVNTLANCNGAVAIDAAPGDSIEALEPINAGAPNPVAVTVVAGDDAVSNELSWNYDAAGGPTNYEVLRDGVVIADLEIAEISIDPVTYVDSGIASATSYDYEVIAYRGSGAARISSVDSVKIGRAHV